MSKKFFIPDGGSSGPIIGVTEIDMRSGLSISQYVKDYLERGDLTNPSALALLKMTYLWAHLRTNVASDDVYYYSFTVPSDKYVILHGSSITVQDGPVFYDTIGGVTSFTDGNSLGYQFFNVHSAYPPPDTEITAGATDVVGGIVVVPDFIPSVGNKIGNARSQNSSVILPPNDVVLVKITNSSGSSNTIQFSGILSEIPTSLFPDYS